jgi:DnaJ-class molecular chaperone
MGKDYYKILELEKTASEKDIKNAYFRLAKEWHPDKNPHRIDEANKKFNDISEAYNVLKDPMKRKTYDNFGEAGLDEAEHGMPSGSGPFGFDPFSMFRDFFQKENDVPDLQIPIKVTLEELYTGTKKKVKIDRFTLCKKCNAKGSIGDNIECKKCEGKGMTVNRTPMGFIQRTCGFCNGSCIDPKAPKCTECNGRTCIQESHTLTVTIPCGSSERHPIIVENEGNEIPPNERRNNSERTNVVFIISEIPHQKYNRGTVIKEIGKINENNLLIEVKLSLEEALCGFEKTFTFLDGKLFKFSLAESSKHGDIYVMKGYGMPYYNDINKKGDLLVKIFIDNKKLTSDQKSKIWKILSQEPYIEIKKSSPNLINFADYKVDAVNENKKESMKDKYRRRHQQHDIDDDDDNVPGAPQCTTQ